MSMAHQQLPEDSQSKSSCSEGTSRAQAARYGHVAALVPGGMTVLLCDDRQNC